MEENCFRIDTKAILLSVAYIVGKEAPKKMELVLASLAVPIQAVTPPSQGSKASDTASQQPSKDKLTIKLKK